MAEQRSTLVKPPPLDSTKAQIENALELTDLSIIGPDIFTNTRELWHPPGARGIYGGAVIAQTLADGWRKSHGQGGPGSTLDCQKKSKLTNFPVTFQAAQRTVPADFVVHSYHCYFVLAGDSSIPIVYYVERVREGRSFCTRTVQARQRGKAIFTVTMSFTKDGSGGAAQVRHAASMPEGAVAPPDDYDEEFGGGGAGGGSFSSPFQTYRIEVTGKDGPAERKKTRHWVRARGRISDEGGHQAHLSALAYVSDSHFIGTVGRIHRLWRFPFPYEDLDKVPEHVRSRVIALNEWEGQGPIEAMEGQPSIGMMVSLDHTIYFHNPKKVRADEWMFTEMESPWSGDGRGVVIQRIFSKDGTLLATCFQEGVVRLTQKEDTTRSKL